MKFFVTGNSAVRDAINLKFVSPVGTDTAIFANKGQTLRQSYILAENIFRLVDKGKINFVIIGLTPDVLFSDENENHSENVFKDNLLALERYVKLCLENGAKPVAVILPVAPSVCELYRGNFLKPLLYTLSEFEKAYQLKVINFFDLTVPKEFFADKTHLNRDGAMITSFFLTFKLLELKVFPEETFHCMSYDYFYALSQLVEKKYFHSLMDRIFSYSVEKLRHKEKIRVAFVTDHAANWCGDKLYNLFAQNPRFETTVFLCRGHESTLEDSQHDLKQFKSAGINVRGIFDLREETPPQDIIFFLRPYRAHLSKSFQFDVLTPQTLLAHIPYGFKILTYDYYLNSPLPRLAWKNFFGTENCFKIHDEKCKVGITRGVVSGYPRMDEFFENENKFSFPWKMTRPDAKKIIWAPHHSFGNTEPWSNHSTFPYNFRFMYEFAKAHQEISWVFKPHPLLMLNAVAKGLFPSVEAYEEYLQAWNDLPNAQVYTGAYYQDIFATSDGMILDSLSFIVEYQYTHKPMIYLSNGNLGGFTELGERVLRVSYIVDGKNPAAIAETVQKIFIEGNDPLFKERLKIFEAELNYLRFNGMTASEFIYKNISQELEEKS